jgi:hypothetical protein
MTMNDRISIKTRAGGPATADLHEASRHEEGQRVSSNRWRTAGFALLAPLTLVGCDGLLDVAVPGAATEAEFENPALARTILVAALGEFECSFAQFVTTTGILAAEVESTTGLRATNIWNSRLDELDNIMGSCTTSRAADGFGYWAPMQTARYLADDGYSRITEYEAGTVPNRDRKLAELSAYGGYAFLLLGEGHCEMAADGGPLLTRRQTFEIAVERFTRALPHADAAGNTSLRHMALMGRARAKLNIGDAQGALADARQIPDGFVRNVAFSSAQVRRENRWPSITITSRRLAVKPTYRGLTVDGVPDVRVPVQINGVGEDGSTVFHQQRKYTNQNQAMPLASWMEAQFIIAEVAGGAEAVAALNKIRAHYSLPAYTGDGNLADVIEERRRTLWLDGHRLGDMLRYNVPFEQGLSSRGDAYGGTTCIALPRNERLSNPNIAG